MTIRTRAVFPRLTADVRFTRHIIILHVNVRHNVKEDIPFPIADNHNQKTRNSKLANAHVYSISISIILQRCITDDRGNHSYTQGVTIYTELLKLVYRDNGFKR